MRVRLASCGGIFKNTVSCLGMGRLRGKKRGAVGGVEAVGTKKSAIGDTEVEKYVPCFGSQKMKKKHKNEELEASTESWCPNSSQQETTRLSGTAVIAPVANAQGDSSPARQVVEDQVTGRKEQETSVDFSRDLPLCVARESVESMCRHSGQTEELEQVKASGGSGQAKDSGQATYENNTGHAPCDAEGGSNLENGFTCGHSDAMDTEEGASMAMGQANLPSVG